MYEKNDDKSMKERESNFKKINMKFKHSFCTERTSLEINVLKVICCIGVVCLHTSFTSIPVGKEDLVVNGGGIFSLSASYSTC